MFGTVWSILSTSMNVAGTVGPLVTAFLISRIGWRESMGLAGKVLATGYIANDFALTYIPWHPIIMLNLYSFGFF